MRKLFKMIPRSSAFGHKGFGHGHRGRERDSDREMTASQEVEGAADPEGRHAAMRSGRVTG